MSRWICEGGATHHVPLSLPADRTCPLCAASAAQRMALRLASDNELAHLHWHEAAVAWLAYLGTIDDAPEREIAALKRAFFTGWIKALGGS